MKTKEEAKANLEASVPMIGARYSAAIERADWATPAGSDNAEKNFADKMSQVIARKTRQLAIKAVSNEAWKQAAITKGAAVIGERVRQAIEKQAANWAPIYDRVVSDISRLPPRTVDFRTNITNRVVGVVESWKKHSGKL